MSKARDLANAGTALTTVSATELGYLDGVTSAVQTQIDSKIGSASAINPTIVDAKGDIVAATAADTVARLAVGANDTVLTADSTAATGLKWATPAAGGMTLISTTTLTGATTTISSIPQTYNTLYLIVKNFRPSSNNNSWRMNFNSDTATRYLSGSGTDFTNYTNTFGVAYIDSWCDTSSTTNDGFSTIEIPNYTNTDTWKDAEICSNMSDGITPTSIKRIMAFGVYNQKVAITSITFKSATGNLSAGTVLLYGVK
jgi:hypothetical protein